MDNIKIGLKGVVEITVSEKDSANNYGNEGVNVFATPAMVGVMEVAARNAVDSVIPEGFSTLGTRLDVKHLAATPVGFKVRATAELLEIDDKRLVFKVEAYDDVEKIGEGVHDRYIIRLDKFMNRVNSKRLK